MATIRTEQIGHVLVITIDNERRRNAINHQMEADLLKTFQEADQNPAVRIVVVTGAGDIAFCSGHDLTELASVTPLSPDPCSFPAQMRKPVVAAVNGHCHAAGLMLAMSSDLRVASENAVFGQPGAKIGMLPVGRQIVGLPLAMKRAAAVEMMMTAVPVPAPQAMANGFLNRLVPQGKALEEAMALATAVAGNSPATVAAIKEGLRVFGSQGVSGFDIFEKQTSETLISGPDAREGIQAFLEKRQPDFS